jgi:Putative amidoligase enzyme
MFSISDRVKINEELCPVEKREERKFQFGSLNYFALFLEWEFEVVKTFNDDYHGEMVECTVLNQDDVKSNIVLKTADCVLASKTMKKIDFEMIGTVNKHQKTIDELRATENTLLLERDLLKKSGKQISDPTLKTNWNSVKSTREKIAKLERSADKVFRVKHPMGTFDLDCKEDQIANKLRQAIRSIRSDRKAIKPIKKEIGGGCVIEKVGGVLTKPNKFVELNEKFAINLIKEHKTPKTQDKYVGIEIEMLSPKSIEDMNKEFIKARLHKFVNIGTDGSVRSDIDSSKPMELRILIPETMLELKLREICEVLRKNDCYANRSCGMHVHLDMRNRDAELCYRNLFKVQDLMLSTQPSQRRTNTYCKPNTIETLAIDEFNNVERYKVINTASYSKYGTIEVRLHEGATKFRDVFNWTKFLVETVNLTSEISTPVKTIKQLADLNYLSSNILSHLENRIEEYSA